MRPCCRCGALRDGVDIERNSPHGSVEMKIQSLVAAVLLGGMLASPAFAANSQQDKMKACNAQAAGKTGDERKAFMKDCLSAKPAKKMSQQEKMKACNTQAADKKGDDRKTFMKSCLSNQPAN
ncbi:PsiF repeat protein [Burkholderia vietnamiensis G4]|uniref:PsiF repeat protein n=2 Tax=Burkholderiaceae TaxID=119060 RepID=A4JEV8_BURVG|nr:PsiF repeat protein [Burkholderia vietnamiensis G4]